MDVYGYPSYQYSDELAKQVYAHQALASSLVPEAHNMPAPSGAPWNAQGMSWGMQSPPQLVQFTGQPLASGPPGPALPLKRKSLDVEPVVPAKLLITEEKMAAHLNSLHISSEFTPHSLASEENMDVGMEVATTATSISEKLKGHRIVLSEEVKKLTEEPLLPAALIERLEKPRMSLVVWTPKENMLEKIKEIQEKDKDKEQMQQEQPTKRNGVLVAEMDIEM